MPSEPQPAATQGLLARFRALVRGMGPAGPWLLFASGGPLLGLMILVATSNTWLDWFGDDVWSVLGYWAAGVALAAGCLVPTHATSLLAGYLFGAWLGTGVGLFVMLVAAAIGFCVWSRLLGTRVLDAIATSPRAHRVHQALLGRGFWRTTWLIALLRISPLMPFAATNLLMATLGVRFWRFMLATLLGVSPRAVAAALVGAELSELDWSAGGNVWSTVVAIVATVACVAVIGRVARRALRQEAGDLNEPPASPPQPARQP